MTTGVTAQRLGRLIAAGDVDAVHTAVESSPRLLGSTVERSGHGGWTPLHVAAARHRGNDAGRATANDDVADLLVAHGVTY